MTYSHMFVPGSGLFVPPMEDTNEFYEGEEEEGYEDGEEGGYDGEEGDECIEDAFDDGRDSFMLEDEDGVHRIVNCVAFDTAAEMVWVGYNDGRLTSFLKQDFVDEDHPEEEDDSPFIQYSAVNTLAGPIRAIDTDSVCTLYHEMHFCFFFFLTLFFSPCFVFLFSSQYGVCTLSSNTFLYSTRGGIQNVNKQFRNRHTNIQHKAQLFFFFPSPFSHFFFFCVCCS